MNALALDCLAIDALKSAMVDLGYINCVLQHKIMIDGELYEQLLEAIEAYEKETTLC
jgi:cobalamin biosynthesis Co2+ chelatase CbiK